jgi:hypothetical protein
MRTRMAGTRIPPSRLSGSTAVDAPGTVLLPASWMHTFLSQCRPGLQPLRSDAVGAFARRDARKILTACGNNASSGVS